MYPKLSGLPTPFTQKLRFCFLQVVMTSCVSVILALRKWGLLDFVGTQILNDSFPAPAAVYDIMRLLSYVRRRLNSIMSNGALSVVHIQNYRLCVFRVCSPANCFMQSFAYSSSSYGTVERNVAYSSGNKFQWACLLAVFPFLSHVGVDCGCCSEAVCIPQILSNTDTQHDMRQGREKKRTTRPLEIASATGS